MTTSTTYLKYGTPSTPGREARLNQRVLDFSVTDLAVSTIYTIWQCPEDYVVFEAGYEILTAETVSSACTLDMGKAGGTELLSAIDLSAAAGTKDAGGLANPVFFKDSDTIDIQLNTEGADTGKIRLWWVGCDVTELNTENDLL